MVHYRPRGSSRVGSGGQKRVGLGWDGSEHFQVGHVGPCVNLTRYPTREKVPDPLKLPCWCFFPLPKGCSGGIYIAKTNVVTTHEKTVN